MIVGCARGNSGTIGDRGSVSCDRRVQCRATYVGTSAIVCSNQFGDFLDLTLLEGLGSLNHLNWLNDLSRDILLIKGIDLTEVMDVLIMVLMVDPVDKEMKKVSLHHEVSI